MAKFKQIEWVTNEKGCHLCTSHTLMPNGYIGYRNKLRNNKTDVMHRVIYEQNYGLIPDGKVIRHTCDEKTCININHLALGTHLDNINDKIQRNRYYKGNIIPTTKLKDIRISKGYTLKMLSESIGVSLSYLSKIENGKYNGSIKVLKNIATTLQVTLDDLIGGK